MKIYSGKGDDGTTGMLFGGRIAKDDTGPEAYGTVDEAVSALGVARAVAEDEQSDELLVDLERQLFVVGAELATLPENRSRLEAGASLVTRDMIDRLEAAIDGVTDRVGMPTVFVVPGGTPLAAALDQARSILRRAERRAVTHLREMEISDSLVVPYLNRVADYVYMLARAAEGTWLPSRPEE
jgi:cob(I)alamin adenosyltransferase